MRRFDLLEGRFDVIDGVACMVLVVDASFEIHELALHIVAATGLVD